MPSEIERFRINIPASKIHHVLHFAKLYIGDSQTMATESALLGTPSIRYNSFVGKNDMSNFILLENKYNLLRNFNDFNNALNCLKGYIEDDKIKNDWLEKRNHYYNKVGDINKKIFTIISSA